MITKLKIMKIKLYSALVLFLFSVSCKKEVRFYPNKKIHTKNNLVVINTMNLEFNEIRRQVNKKQYQDSIVSVKLEEKKYWNNVVIGISSFHSKKSNKLTVGSDSIFIDKGYKIDKLEELMIRHYSNNGKNVLYPYHFSKAWIEINLKDESKEFNRTLLNIIDKFESVNKLLKDSLELKILLKQKIPPPPPPPPVN